jgi:hypothetical protein
MKQRCTNPNVPAYHHYGGRGIRVCPEWAGSFVRFLADMGAAPPGHSLDRIDVNGHYEPSNCRWATAEQQQRNRRNSVSVDFNGQKVAMPELAARFGLNRGTLAARLRLGWPIEVALSAPVVAQRGPRGPYRAKSQVAAAVASRRGAR